MIVSALRGRIRIRNEVIKNSALTTDMRDKLLSLQGILDVSTNELVGSMLILYDTERINLEKIESVLTSYLGDNSNKTAVQSGIGSRKNRVQQPFVKQRIAKTGMTLSLVISLSSLALSGSKKLHFYAGLAFVLFVGLHLSSHEWRILS